MAMCRTLAAASLSAWVVATAVGLAQSGAYGVGRTPTPDEIAAMDSAIGPSGAELPPGSATAAQGKAVYTSRCAGCHGATGKEGPNDVLAGGQGTLTSERPIRTVGSYWPYATTLFDYIRRAMPYATPGVLTDEEVYGATAYILFLNGIVGELDAVDAKTLIATRMPNRGGFVADPRPDVGGKQRR
jgi:S-disulfanyl-L-cysteine oxidoreductase SoxD